MHPNSTTTPAVTIQSAAEIFEETFGDIQEPGPDQPRVLFRSSMVLTRAQEDKLCAAAKRWYQNLDEQLGRSDTSLAHQDMAGFYSGLSSRFEERMERRFFEKRLLYQLISENNMEHRKALNPGSIFYHSNLIVPLARRICTQMSARAINYFFGTDPWMAQYPVGGEADKILAQTLQKLTESKFQDSGSTDALRRSIPQSFIIGEAVMKVTHTHEQEFYREAIVCAVGPDGKTPLVAADGEPITPADTFSAIPDPANPDPAAGAMVFVLDRDKQTPIPDPEALVFAEVVLDRQVTLYRGPRATQIYYRDFLCPLNAPSVQEAECCIHVIERTPSQIVGTYIEAASGADGLEQMQKAVAAVRDALGNSKEAKTGDRGARAELSETSEVKNEEAVAEYGEFYIRFDADEDMVTEDVFLVMNLQTGFPIFYDYVANVTSTQKRPFYIIRPKAVLNRWYGQGAIETFEAAQEQVDLLVNRRNFNQSGSGRVVLWRPELTYEGQDNPNLEFNWGTTYRPLPGANMDDILRVIYVDDNKMQALTEELEFMLQLAMNESGISNANDGNVAGMETTKLATGIRNIEKSGQESFGVVISELDGGAGTGITGVANAFTKTLYANLDDEETFQYFEGEMPVELTVAGADVKNLGFNVRTLLTRYKDAQVLESSTQGIAVVKDYYSLPPLMQMLLSGLYRDSLRSLQIPRSDEYIQPQQIPLLPPQGAGPAVHPVSNPAKQGQPLL